MLWIVWILIILAVLFVLVIIYYFNRLTVLSNRIDNSLAQIDVQLRKRADLIPNLMNTVRGYVKHEKAVFKQLTDARKEIMNAKDTAKRVKAGNKLQETLKSIFAIAESTPQLKANENFLKLQEELSAIEDKVAYARQFYNDSILSYDNIRTTFPGNMFAGMFGKGKKPYLEIPAESRAVPKVSF
jgi:LemA protein